MTILIPVFNENTGKNKDFLMTELAQIFKVKTTNGMVSLQTAPIQNYSVVNYIQICTNDLLVNENYITPQTTIDPDIKLKSLYLTFGDSDNPDTSKILRFDMSKLLDNKFDNDNVGQVGQNVTFNLAIRVGSVTTSGDPLFEDKADIPGLDDDLILFMLEVKSNIVCNFNTGYISAGIEIEPSYEPFRLALEEKYGGRLFVAGYDLDVKARH